MEKFDLTKLPELDGHPELKANMESAWEFLRAEQYRAAANELRQALEYITDCYMTASCPEAKAAGDTSLYDRIEFLKNGAWISSAQADSFHSVRMRCNAGVHRNTSRQGKQMNPADLRYSYELLVQSLPDFLLLFSQGVHSEGKAERNKSSFSGITKKEEKERKSKYPFEEYRAGEASEGVFSEMMEALLKRLK